MATESDNDQSGGRLDRVVETVDEIGDMTIEAIPFGSDDEEEPEPIQAELVDGAEILFIDPRAKTKDLEEFALVALTADEYPQPAILRCRDAGLHIPEGSAMVRAGDSSLLRVGDRRVIVRQFTLAPPDRTDELDPRDAELVLEAFDGLVMEPSSQAEGLVESAVQAVRREENG